MNDETEEQMRRMHSNPERTRGNQGHQAPRLSEQQSREATVEEKLLGSAGLDSQP